LDGGRRVAPCALTLALGLSRVLCSGGHRRPCRRSRFAPCLL